METLRLTAALHDYDQVRDLTSGATRPLSLPTSNVIAFILDDGSRVIARPSGTEPKIKFYYEGVVDVAADQPLATAREAAADKVDALVAAVTALVGL